MLLLFEFDVLVFVFEAYVCSYCVVRSVLLEFMLEVYC